MAEIPRLTCGNTVVRLVVDKPYCNWSDSP